MTSVSSRRTSEDAYSNVVRVSFVKVPCAWLTFIWSEALAIFGGGGFPQYIPALLTNHTAGGLVIGLTQVRSRLMLPTAAPVDICWHAGAKWRLLACQTRAGPFVCGRPECGKTPPPRPDAARL
ncbi:hypothetical protein Bbelb_337280 [Branchiostoma belcheri]|nr:hypothetical protein Bbelb_337280 [Branchiostoma belcheri]